jgi:hypothetical protein
MKSIITPRYIISQAPPPPTGGDGGAPPGMGAPTPPPPPPSKYFFHEPAKNDKGEWGAYFTEKATGRRFFVSEENVRKKAIENEKGAPDAEVSKALARIESAKLSQDKDNASFTIPS